MLIIIFNIISVYVVFLCLYMFVVVGMVVFLYLDMEPCNHHCTMNPPTHPPPTQAHHPFSQAKQPAIQKKAYKLLAYLCESRPSFISTHANDVVETLIASFPSAQSASKRYRLRCLRVAVVLTQRDDVELSDGARQEVLVVFVWWVCGVVGVVWGVWWVWLV